MEIKGKMWGSNNSGSIAPLSQTPADTSKIPNQHSMLIYQRWHSAGIEACRPTWVETPQSLSPPEMWRSVPLLLTCSREGGRAAARDLRGMPRSPLLSFVLGSSLLLSAMTKTITQQTPKHALDWLEHKETLLNYCIQMNLYSFDCNCKQTYSVFNDCLHGGKVSGNRSALCR